MKHQIKNIVLLFILFIILVSCDNANKYKIVIYKLNDNQETKEVVVTIEATNDSIALIRAYERFFIYTEIYKKSVVGAWNDGYIPNSFKLLNDKNIEITNSVTIENENSLIMEMHKQIQSLKEYANFPKYSIINHKDNSPYKVSYDIQLNRRCTKNELSKIKEYLLDGNSGIDDIYILFYLPGMKVGAGAWATANSNSDIMINEYMLDMNPTSIK